MTGGQGVAGSNPVVPTKTEVRKLRPSWFDFAEFHASEVPMPYCPDCRQEYEQGVGRCGDCGAALAAGAMPGLMAAAPGPEEKWTVLMRVRRPETAAIVRGLLESEGFEVEVIDKGASEMPVPAVATVSWLEVWVPESEAAEARGLLNEAREGTKACTSCGHMSTAGEPACEYCGAAL